MTIALTEMPVDLYVMDETAREIAFLMVLSRETWPGPLLAMKRMYAIETESGIRFDYRQFGFIQDASKPIRIHDRDCSEVMEYPTIQDMLQDGWMVD